MSKFLVSLLLIAWGFSCLALLAPAESVASREITVFAAASLTSAFKEIGRVFEAAHPGVKVTFSFAGSQQLRAQVEQGANPDVFASANLDEIKALAAKKFVSEKDFVIFARNQLVIAVSRSSDVAVKKVQDLAAPKLKLVIADEAVPVGRYTIQFLETASKDPAFGADFKKAMLDRVVSKEANVRSVLVKVALGEADAGIVYSSDLKSVEPGKVYALSIPEALNQVARYPIAPLAHAPNPELAHAFIAAVQSAEGRKVLARYGFIVD